MDDQKFILIIDNHPEIYAALGALFQRYGYTCSIVGNGLEALHGLRLLLIDLIILEINLPDVNGLCLISMLKRMCPDLPVLVLSDDSSAESIFAALRLGVAGYLLKPVEPYQVFFCAQETFKERALASRKPYSPQKRAPHRVKSRRSWNPEPDEVY